MANPLQEQLLKAGLVKKAKLAEVVREQTRQRHGKAPPAPSAEQLEAARAQAQRAERDRALAAERNTQRRAAEVQAQVRQIVDAHKLPRSGEIAYRFEDGGAIRSILVDPAQRTQLAKGILVVVRHDGGYELVPRAAAEKVYARDAAMIALDHGTAGDASASDRGDADPFYDRFQVPDDLVW